MSDYYITKLETKIQEAVEIAFRFGQILDNRHKTWVVDQMLRCLLGDEYEKHIEEYEEEESREWEVGVAP